MGSNGDITKDNEGTTDEGEWGVLETSPRTTRTIRMKARTLTVKTEEDEERTI